MNIIRNLGLILPSIILATACSNEPTTVEENAAPQAEPTSTQATYTAVLDVDYPPYGLRDENGQAAGFDVDILNAIASHQGFTVDIVPTSWELALKSLKTSEHNIAMGGIVKDDIEDPIQLSNYNFSIPYVYGRDALATLPSTNNITQLEDLTEYRVSVLDESQHVGLIEELQAQSTNGELLAEDTTFLAFKDLFLGKADAVLADEGVLRYFHKTLQDEDFDIHQEGDYFAETEGLVFMVSKQNPELETMMNQGIEKVINDGSYEEIYRKWFDVAPNAFPSEEPDSSVIVE